MRVTLLGVRDEQGKESWRTDALEGLRQLGHEVDSFPYAAASIDVIEKSAVESDCLLWLKDKIPSPREDVSRMLERLKEREIPTLGLHLDLYHGIAAREPEIGVEPWWQCQHVFSPDGGRRDWRGVNHHWFPPAFGTRYLRLAEPVERYRHEAVFVGAPIQRIHGSHRLRLLRWAQRQWRRGFAHYGKPGRKIWGDQLNTLYASAGIVVGDSAYAPYYWSDRVPRTLGRGGILAHPRVEGMAEQGFDDLTMVLYEWGRYQDIVDRFDSMSEQDRSDMREAALTVVAERHTWKVALGRALREAGL